MRSAAACLIALALSAAYAAAPNRLTPSERAEGWRLLFDGRTTTGWEEITGKPFPSRCWRVEDGCLEALVRPDGFQDIRTVAAFGSFELEFDWKVPAGGNSGVKYLIQRVDEWTTRQGRQARARGLEYQLADDAGVPDPRRAAGSLYSLIAPVPFAPSSTGVFHHARLVVRGRRVEHWLDGVRVVAFDTGDPRVRALLRGDLPKGSPPDAPLHQTSPISLQNHGTEAWFRNLRIRPLPPR